MKATIMKHTIVITTGTTPCAIGLDLLRQRQAWIDQLKQLSLDSNLQQQLALLESGIQVIGIDIDGTHVYPNHTPLNNVITEWRTGDFILCSAPRPDLIHSIEAGRHPGRFENFNRAGIRALQSGTHAAGGARSNGYIAFEINKDTIDRTIRNCFKRTLTNRTDANAPEEQLRVILVASSLGGFGSGSFESLKQLVRSSAQALQINLQFSCVLLIPGGVNTGKDLINAQAITAAMLKELVATSTGCYYQRQRQPGHAKLQSRLSAYVPTIVISDINHADPPQGLFLPDQISLVSQLLLTLATSTIGARREAQSADFIVKASETTIVGEPKFGISMGFSSIVLGRDRLRRYAILKLADAVMRHLLTSISADAIKKKVEDFILQQRVLAGQNEQLLNRLLEEPTESGLLTLNRTLSLVDANTQSLKGMTLLRQAETQTWLAFQQALDAAEDIETVLEERRSRIVKEFEAQLQSIVVEVLRLDGIAALRQFLTMLIRVLNLIAAEAARELPQYEESYRQTQSAIEAFQTQTIPTLQQLLDQPKPWFNSRSYQAKLEAQIDEKARYYLSILKQNLRNWLKHKAQIAVVKTLEQLQSPVRAVLLNWQHIETTAIALSTDWQQQLKTVVAYDPKFECPNGLFLIKTGAELDEYYARILPETESFAVDEVIRQLLPDALPQFQASEQLKATIEHHVTQLIQPSLNRLHVVNELKRRFPTEAELGAALRQRDRESHELIQLRDNCDTEHNIHLIRLLGLDQAHAGNLPALLRQYAYARGTDYNLINTSDPERILFFQERAVFPFTAWAHEAAARDAYQLVSNRTAFEKLHVRVGDRALITPGQLLTPIEADAVIVRSWLLGRIEPRSHRAQIQLSSDAPIPLNQAQTILCSAQGYRYSTEIISQFGNLLMQQGAESIGEQLIHLQAVQAEQMPPHNPLEATIAALIAPDSIARLLDQLNWWQQNIVPQAMET